MDKLFCRDPVCRKQRLSAVSAEPACLSSSRRPADVFCQQHGLVVPHRIVTCQPLLFTCRAPTGRREVNKAGALQDLAC